MMKFWCIFSKVHRIFCYVVHVPWISFKASRVFLLFTLMIGRSTTNISTQLLYQYGSYETSSQVSKKHSRSSRAWCRIPHEPCFFFKCMAYTLAWRLRGRLRRATVCVKVGYTRLREIHLPTRNASARNFNFFYLRSS